MLSHCSEGLQLVDVIFLVPATLNSKKGSNFGSAVNVTTLAFILHPLKNSITASAIVEAKF
jgi:hypothetical protein